MRWSIVLTASVVFTVFQGIGRADTFTATVSCGSPITAQGSTPQTLTAGCPAGTGGGTFANATVASGYGFLGIDAMLTAGRGGTDISTTSQWMASGLNIEGPSVAILPTGTPLTAEIVAVANGSMGWVLPDNGLFNSRIELQLISPGSGATTSATTIYACGNDIPSIDPSLDCDHYGDSGSVSQNMSASLVVNTAVAQSFGFTAIFNIAAHADTPSGSLEDNFWTRSI